MRFGVLGPLVVEADDGTAMAIGSPSQRTVLAMLLAHEGRSVRAELLVDALWGEQPPASASQSLRTYISRLRRVLGDRITSASGSYALILREGELDSRQFEDLVERSRSLSPAEAGAVLRQAFGLWRGDPYCDVADGAGLGGVARRLEELHSGAREALASAALAAGDPLSAVAGAEAIVATDPLREGAWAVLVHALVADNRSADALRAYQRAGHALAEAGLDPGPVLREAEAAALDPERTSPPRATGSVTTTADPDTVPAAGSAGAGAAGSTWPRLIGRQNDLALLEELLAGARVVTLHGPGGVGKTRLAQEVARRQKANYRAGVRVVELAPVADPAAVPVAVADAMGLVVDTGDVAGALSRAGTLDTLVLLDNCEHVVDAVAAVVERLVSTPGPLRVLVTSRERVGVAGEHSWPITPLAADDADSPAVELFFDRAKSHAPTLEENASSRAVVARIVAHLDGLPLAIEMAAARLGGFGLRDLEAALAEQVDILRSAHRRGDQRHRTMRTVIEWSEQLLSDDERDTLRQLSVFAGPVPAGDIEAVVDGPAALATVADLVERSLAMAEHAPQQSRYGLLGLVRRHQIERLEASGEANATRRRHAEHFVGVAVAADESLRTVDEARAVQTLHDAFDELRAAHGWARQHSPSLAVALSAALHLYAVSRQREEAQLWAVDCLPLLEGAQGANPVAAADAAIVLASVAYRANDLGSLDEAEAAATRALELVGDHVVARVPTETLADTALYRGDLQQSGRLAERFMDLAVRAGDPYSVAMAASTLALSRAYRSDVDAALDVIAAVDRTGMGPSAEGWLAYSEAETLLTGDPELAGAKLATAIELADSVDHRFLSSVARVSMASLLGRTAEPTVGLGAFADIVGHWEQRGDRTHQLTTLRNLVELFARVEAYAPCAELLGAVNAAALSPTWGDEAARLDEARSAAASALGPDFAAREATGAARDISAAVTAALEAIADLT